MLVDVVRDAVDGLYRQLADSDLSVERTVLAGAKRPLDPTSIIEELRPQTGEPEPETRRLRKISALNGASSCLDAITYPGCLHPAAIYTELCRLAGHLSVFHSGRLSLLDPPIYDHEYPGPCFRVLIAIIKDAVSARQGTAFQSTEEIPTFAHSRRRDPGELRCIPKPAASRPDN